MILGGCLPPPRTRPLSPSAPLLQLVDGAEAKACYGLAVNWGPLQALVERLLVKETLPGKEVAETLEAAGVIRFPDPFVEGFGWAQGGGLVYPGMPSEVRRPVRRRQPGCAGCHAAQRAIISERSW